jgi:hypothetical protein
MEVRRIRLRILKGNTFPYAKQIFFMTVTAESPASLGHSPFEAHRRPVSTAENPPLNGVNR